ncbi:nuclease-related domain-containing protein [Zeimonas arvi]|nr:nuclease-related domain-containing protein [Zeimonas arvi]
MSEVVQGLPGSVKGGAESGEGLGWPVSESRSPLKDKPLRLPGQSVDEQRRKLIENEFEIPVLVALLLTLLAGFEWWRDHVAAPPAPRLMTAVALVAVAAAAWRFHRLRPRLHALRLAAEGEKAVGQYLEGLRVSGYRVFHDVVGIGFNVDHVLIGPAGVFTVETKTWSKPRRGDARVVFDGARMAIGGREPDDRVAVQALAQARWLRGLLADSTGKRMPVRPIVLFPGWFVEQGPGATRGIWVLEPKALPAFLSKAPHVLAPEDVALASTHLSRMIRVQERDAS